MNLAGALHLRWQAGRPLLRSTRREWATLVGQGRPAEALPTLLASVYTLCGGAHRITATLAVRAARGEALLPSGAECGADRVTQSAADGDVLRQDALQEHVRRLWLEGPALLPELDVPGGHALRAMPLATTGTGRLAWPVWIEREVLGMPPREWWAAWCAAPQAFAADWAATGATWPARWLAGGRRALGGLALPPRALPLPTAELAAALAGRLDEEAGFALKPLLHGAAAETGPWTRALPLAAPEEFEPLWMRLAARIAELARLALYAYGQTPLALGALPLGARTGMAWCETARGLLLHHVVLTPEGRVQRCHVVAPTEWNFHPDGAAVAAWAQLGPAADMARVRWVAAAFDPCVALQCEAPLPEAADA